MIRKVLDRIGSGGRGASITLGELVEEYLDLHQAEPVTIAKQVLNRQLIGG